MQNKEPIFGLTPFIGAVNMPMVNTNRDGTGNIYTVVTAGAEGSRITQIVLKTWQTIGAGIVRLYISDGSTSRLWREFLVAAVTPSATVKTWEQIISLTKENALILKAGELLTASRDVNENVNVIAFGFHY